MGVAANLNLLGYSSMFIYYIALGLVACLLGCIGIIYLLEGCSEQKRILMNGDLTPYDKDRLFVASEYRRAGRLMIYVSLIVMGLVLILF